MEGAEGRHERGQRLRRRGRDDLHFEAAGRFNVRDEHVAIVLFGRCRGSGRRRRGRGRGRG